MVQALDPARRIAILDDKSELPYDLFLGIPKHRVPDVVAQSGMTENGWIPVNPKNLRTRFPGVYAIGDVTSVLPTPKPVSSLKVPHALPPHRSSLST
jgi:sulfide:quinone oxidoreductase